MRDSSGRFIRKPVEQLSPGYRRRVEPKLAQGLPLAVARGHSEAPKRDSRDLFGSDRYEKSLRVLARMREGESLTVASRAEGIRPDTVRRNVGSTIERHGNTYRATAQDHLYRRMEFLSTRGYIAVEPANSHEATKLSRYHTALARYLERGDERSLRKFGRMRLRLRDKSTLAFVTDLDAIDRLAAAGALSFTSIYRYVT